MTSSKELSHNHCLKSLKSETPANNYCQNRSNFPATKAKALMAHGEHQLVLTDGEWGEGGTVYAEIMIPSAENPELTTILP